MIDVLELTEAVPCAAFFPAPVTDCVAVRRIGVGGPDSVFANAPFWAMTVGVAVLETVAVTFLFWATATVNELLLETVAVPTPSLRMSVVSVVVLGREIVVDAAFLPTTLVMDEVLDTVTLELASLRATPVSELVTGMVTELDAALTATAVTDDVTLIEAVPDRSDEILP